MLISFNILAFYRKILYKKNNKVNANTRIIIIRFIN